MRHPAALGRPFDDLWHDIWDQVGPILSRAYAGESTHMDDIAFAMHRNGYPEEPHFAFGYTPVRDETGRVAGMFCACQETTGQVLAERRSVASASGCGSSSSRRPASWRCCAARSTSSSS